MYEAHEEEYKGYTIKIINDECAENPWESWDSEPPIVVSSDRDLRSYGKQDVNGAPELTRDEIKANLARIMEIADYSSLKDMVHDANYHAYSLEDGIQVLLNRALDNETDSDRLEIIAELYEMKGITAVVKSVTGYVQGDWAEVLAVATPEFLKETGAPNTGEMLEQSIKLYGYWAFGDVWGYSVEKDGEQVDSCWGYYGDHPEYGGAIEAAKEAVDAEVDRKQAEHEAKLKAQIKNHVPFQYRESFA